MKLITSLEEVVNNNLDLQFIFGAKLVAFPRTDRWDEVNKRLQSIGADGKLMNAWTYHWQRATLQGESYVALHIEDYGFSPEPMQELYPAELFGEDGEAFLEEYGHLSSTEYVTQEIIDTDENITTITTP
jgi:hypothetical protein